MKLPDTQAGDLVGILKSGAYGLTASPIKFLSHDHPMEVLAYKGDASIIRRQSRVEEILDNQVLVRINERRSQREVGVVSRRGR